MPRLYIFISSFFLVLLFVQPCLAEQTIRIGFVADFSAVAKEYGEAGHRAALLAVEEINSRGGLSGQRVVLVKRDGQNDPHEHYRHVEALSGDSSVSAILGVGSSLCIAGGSEAAEKNRIPYLASLGNAASITVENGHPYIFQFQPNSAMETKSWAMLMTLFPWKSYAWVGPDYSWGHETYADFINAFEDIGADITIKPTLWHPLGHNDFIEIVEKVKRAQPEMLIIGSWGKDIANFYRAASEQNLLDEIGVFGRFTGNISQPVDRDIEQDIWVPSRGPFKYLASKYQRTDRFVSRFKERYGTYPNSIAICCYDAILAWHAAAQKAGRVDRQHIAESLKGIHFKGLRGDSYIRAVDGQMNCSSYLGLLRYDPEYDSSVLDHIVEVKAEQTWLTSYEVLEWRKRTNEHDSQDQ